MASKTKMKIKRAGDGSAQVLVLVNHPMETGTRKDKKTGELVPEHFIQTMQFTRNGEVVAETQMGTAVSKNPLLGIELASTEVGDKIGVSWTDNKGESDTAETMVK